MYQRLAASGKVTRPAIEGIVQGDDPESDGTPLITNAIDVKVTPEVEAEILEGLAEFERGEYIELTPQQLARAAATGEWPWTDEDA